jgi:hypothetical protein
MVVQLLAAGIAGIALGAISVVVGLAELRHRDRMARADTQAPAAPRIVAAPRPVRGRWV